MIVPVKAYYKGHGLEVMRDMLARYGQKKGKSVFYAKANKNPKLKPAGEK